MFPKIELHLHLDGAIRFETLANLARKKSLPFPSYEPSALKERIVIRKPVPLEHVLNSFYSFVPAFCADPDAIERIAYELCQTQASQRVIYFETRFTPHFLSNTVESDFKCEYKGHGDVGPEKVLESALRGLKRGGDQFGIKWGLILSCLPGYPKWNEEILQMCIKYKDQGVVAIDLAGAPKEGQEYIDGGTKAIFEEAKKLGIHRTVHAEASPTGVMQAIEILHAARIGHGYRLVDDEEKYKKVALQGGYHFELCPLSSWTIKVVDEDWTKHPARRFAQDKANFSINTDDPTCFGNSMESEFELCRQKLGFTDHVLRECQLNAAKSAFVTEPERTELVNQIKCLWPQ